MASSGLLSRVALVRTDVSEELSSSSIRVTRMGELVGTLASNVPISPILVTLMLGALNSSEMSVLTRATRRDIPEDAILRLWHMFDGYVCIFSFRALTQYNLSQKSLFGSEYFYI
jgi:hypothetical protein